MVLNAVMFDFSYTKHAHEELALGVTMEGVQEFTCNGSQFRSHPGNIILFNPGDVHTGNPGNGEALVYTMLYLDTKDFYPLLWSTTESDQTQFRFAETHFKDAVLQSLILELARIIADNKRLSVEYGHCRYQIAERLAQRIRLSSTDSRTRNKDTLLLKVQNYIHDNIIEDISIDDLSQVANISKYHFIRMFRNQFGLTPHKYILNLKVNKARTFLETGTPPSEVAQEFGFFDVSHLNRHFKRSFGITPKQYQLQLKR
jgi:AraC-like DNA-binding protein